MSRSKMLVLCRLFAAAALFCAALNSFADVNAAVFGVVNDSTGAVVAGARVSLTNEQTGLHRETTTGKDGNYEFVEIPVGEGYAVHSEIAGFRTSEQTGIRLVVDQRLRVDFQMQVGQVAEQTTVEANTVQVETSVTQLGDVIEDKKIQALPLNGRSYLDLLGLQAGVAPASVAGGNGNVSVNGQRENANGFMINGGSVEDTGGNNAAVIPVLDSIQEFRLLTSAFDAEYGHFSGALVNVITKSGTNSIHGTAFEFLRNNVLDARNYFDAVGPVGTFRRNQFGGVIGGPVIKNRMFFFADYQGNREARGFTSSRVGVLSAAERTGDFSAVASNLNGTVAGTTNAPGTLSAVLTSRLGYTVNPGEPYYTSGCTTQAQAQAGVCVFPGAIIPQSAWSPAAIGTLKFIPNPSAGAVDTYSSNAFLTTANENKFGTRIDLNTLSTGNWSFYYNYTGNKTSPAGNNPNFSYTRPFRAQQFNFSNTLSFHSTSVNEFRVNVTRFFNPGNTAVGGLGKVSSFGFVEGGQGIIPSRPSIEGVPTMFFTEGLALGSAVKDGNIQDSIQATDSVSKLLGNHTLRFGGAFGYYQWNRRGGPDPNGVYGFDGSQTGVDFADYLLGVPGSFTQSSAQSLDARSKMVDLYGQDSVRIRQNLTVNFGLRWEVSQPWYDTTGKIQAFIPGQQSTTYPNAPTGWLFPGDKGIPKTLGKTRWNNFAPRLGLAYAPSSDGWMKGVLGSAGQTSIRAGAGLFYTDFDTSGQNFATGDAPFGLFVNGAPHPYLEQPYVDYATGANKLQPFPYAFAGAATNFAPFLPIAFSPAFDTRNKLPYSINYHLTWQRELGRSTILSVGYVGSAGRHLYQQIANNLGNPQLCLSTPGCGPGGEDTIYNVGGQTVYGTRQYSVTSGKYLGQGLLDFGDNSYESTIGTSSYNSLQTTLTKNIGDFHFLAAYTYGKALDYGSGFYDLTNPYNIARSKGLSQFDVTHNFVLSYSYALPFTRLLSNRDGVAGKILGGWQLAGITRLSTGFPITLTDSSNGSDTSLCGCDLYGILGANAVDLPNYDGTPVKKFDPRKNSLQYFSASPFSSPAIGTMGNARRRFLHGPGRNNTDVSLVKSTQVTERIGFDFRIEFFNVFNHTQFNGPVGDINAGNFGTVTSALDPRIGQAALKINF